MGPISYFSQKASIAELKVQLDEERDQRREEREKATLDLKAAVQRVLSEAQEELQRLSDGALKREKEQQEVINKLEVRMIFFLLAWISFMCNSKELRNEMLCIFIFRNH